MGPQRRAARASAPRLAGTLPVVDPADLPAADDWIGADVKGGRNDPDSSPPEVSGCRFTNCSIVGAALEDVRMHDVLFEGCDLSGLDLGGAKLDNVVMLPSRVDGSSFRAVRGKNVEREECDLSGTDFSGAELDGARLVGCDLTGCQFSGAKLSGARLDRSVLDEIRGVAGLKGVVIDPTQAVSLGLLMLGAMDVRIDAGDSTDGCSASADEFR